MAVGFVYEDRLVVLSMIPWNEYQLNTYLLSKLCSRPYFLGAGIIWFQCPVGLRRQPLSFYQLHQRCPFLGIIAFRYPYHSNHRILRELLLPLPTLRDRR